MALIAGCLDGVKIVIFGSKYPISKLIALADTNRLLQQL